MVKWTAETDQTLLLKILETSNVQVDPKAIAAAWPTDKPEKERPTPRAVTERLVKIRQNAKAQGTGAGNFSVSSAKSKGPRPARTAPATPRKRQPKNENEVSVNSNDETSAALATPPNTGSKRTHEQSFKVEEPGDDYIAIGNTDLCDSPIQPESPSKRLQTSTRADHGSLDSGYGSSFRDIEDFAYQEQVF